MLASYSNPCMCGLSNHQHFHRLEWRRSKEVKDLQDLVDYGFPDLEWELVLANRYRFAVECKWPEKYGMVKSNGQRKMKSSGTVNFSDPETLLCLSSLE